MRTIFPYYLIKCCNKVAVLAVLCFALCITTVKGQDELARKNALSLIAKHAADLQLSKSQLTEVVVSSTYHDKLLNADLVYLQQTIQGIPVMNTIKTIAFKNDKVLSVSGKYYAAANGMVQKNATPSVKAADAVVAAAKDVNLVPSGNMAAQKTTDNGRKAAFGNMGISESDITAELMWQPTDNNDLNLVWQVKVVPHKSSDYWLIQVDAHSGKAINKMNLTVFCNWGDQKVGENNFVANLDNNEAERFLAPPPPAINNADYRVLPYPVESPSHGAFSLVSNPWLQAGAGNNAASLGWQNDGTTEYNITRGNNVWSKEDRAADNETTIGVSTTSSTASPNYSFNDIFDPATSAIGSVNQKAAITNLFYWNNIVHDITYQYGFDEASGNFQNDNQGRGGSGADYVLADAQDGSGSNNANFGTPADGGRPRMQMFLFSPAPATILKVNSSPVAIPAMNAFEFTMSANNKLANVGPVTGNLVLYDNGTNNGCAAAAAGSFTGKHVLVLYNGGCNPEVAVKNAQNAGAIGLIMQLPSNIPANSYTQGPDNTITIPSVNINFAPGNNLKSAMLSGTVNITLAGINLDGDFDNGVVVHEYGHGISNRLTGGPANSACLQNKEQMGEGWSDYYSLMLTTNWATTATTDGANNRPIGTYVFGQPPTGSGIRRYPYTTNMTINPWTYGMLATGTTSQGVPGQVHLMGEIWAATLWDMTWNIIAQQNSISSNLYDAGANGGNNISMKLVTQGLKLQPCSPGFLDGRNAILKADTMLYGGKYSCAIWRAFARRGMGKNAIQGSSNSVLDQTEDFIVPAGMGYDTLTVCDSTVWNAITYKTSGDYTFTTTGQGGCDSIANLHLTVNYSSSSDTTAAVCNSFIWRGVTYYTTGDKIFKTTNAVGCDSTITLHLTILSVPNSTAKTDPTCYGSTNGSITINATGGTSPFTYRLGTVGPINSATNTFGGLKAGTYRVYVQDATGCIGVSVVVLPQPAKTTATVTSSPVTGCNGGSNGKITISNPIGTAPFKYKVSTTGTYTAFTAPFDITGLKGGNYSIYIQDANGCEGPAPVATVLQPAPITATLSVTPITCYGANDGKITITNVTGTPPFMFKVSNTGTYAPLTLPLQIIALRAGTYRLYFKDANGCESQANVVAMAQPAKVSATFTKVDETCPSSLDGSITATGTGGTPPYQYKLNTTGAYGNSSMFTGLAGGTYKVYVKDANGCLGVSAVITVLVTTDPCPPPLPRSQPIAKANEADKALNISLSPNPSSNQFTLKAHSGNMQPVSVRVLDANGRKVYEAKGMPEQSFRFGEMWMSGLYLVEVRQGEEVKTVKAVKGK